MSNWYERPWARPAIRLGGAFFLYAARSEGRLLTGWVRADAGHDVGPVELLLGMLMFASASVGVAFLLFGPDLWKKVSLPDRWAPYPVRKPGSG